MGGLVVFLHGYTGNRYSWGAVPDKVRASLESFEVAILEYSAAAFSPSTIQTNADRVMTELLTRYPKCEPIYFVGHSLGGLVARELCRKLLAREVENDTLLDKIPAVITFGTPLEGPRFRRTIKAAQRFLPSKVLPTKVRQMSDDNFVFDRYREAIRIARPRTVRRPKHIHVRIEDDQVIAEHVRGRFTDDDFDGGVVPGFHSGFVEDNATAQYVADVVLLHIRNVQTSFSAPYIQTSDGEKKEGLPDRLVLIACSNRKQSGGNVGFKGPPPARWVPEPGLRQRIISKRSNVFSQIADAKLADGFKKGGNRIHQRPNQELKHGPDLGGVIDEQGSYLPASQRYTGRSYAPVSAEAWKSFSGKREKLTVLIMSGLYGLIEPDESIQEYDLHLTDTHVDTGQPVTTMWSGLFTEAVSTYVRHAYRGDRKVRIYNFLCDPHYVGAIQWQDLPKECSVFHLASPDADGVDLLPPAGAVLNAFLLDPGWLDRIDRDEKQYPVSDFGKAPPDYSDVRLIFESRVGLSKRQI